MFKVNIIMLFLLMLSIVGCSKNIPPQLSDELEKISDFKIGFIALVDSDTGQTEFLKNTKAEADYVKSHQPASEIRKITSVSIVGVSGVKFRDMSYSSCSYISFDNQRELICANNENQDHQPSPNITDISADLADELGKAGKINNIGFLVLTDFKSGETKLLKNKDYISLPANLPQPISAIKSSSSWSTIFYKKNPCYMLVDKGGGRLEWVFYPDKHC
ncbi:hypothetical protein C8R34_1061 [Nitrosomonas sp. Nm84]|uniref:hypothetical protein n=1 Tax=Nitrosomonas sp. Nm84 TaxID=200124 RepID=UPI000D75CF76|nr:hypothetical protein [Nitrosomonas sp. Nm84]PXW88855.1 hypothetical protein C8R34_1061 [Nitrosomonas sp. Nm84]